MVQATAEISKIPTGSHNWFPASRLSGRNVVPRLLLPGGSQGGSERAASRGDGEVITLDCGITVYPARSAGGRWQAVWHEDGRRE